MSYIHEFCLRLSLCSLMWHEGLATPAGQGCVWNPWASVLCVSGIFLLHGGQERRRAHSAEIPAASIPWRAYAHISDKQGGEKHPAGKQRL